MTCRPLLGFVLLLATASHAQTGVTVQRLAGHDTDRFDHFGRATDLLGPYALVLAEWQGRTNSGAVYVFRYDSAAAGGVGAFVEETQLFPTRGVLGGGAALMPGPPNAPEQWLALVGAAGTAQMWRRVAGVWIAELRPDLPGNTFEGGGAAVDLVRDTAGTEYAVIAENDSVFVWRRAADAPADSTGWTLDGALGSEPEGLSAASLTAWAAPDGSVAVAVADRAALPLEAVVFRRGAASGAWAEEARLTGAALIPGHFFGTSIAAERQPAVGQERVVVGAPYRRPPYDRDGQAYAFRRDPLTGAWAEEARFAPSALAASFGFSVGIDGGLVAVNGNNRIHLYRRAAEGAWGRTGEFRYYPDYGAVDYSGLALSGSRVLFGSFIDEARGQEAGAAWLFTIPGELTPNEPAAPPPVAFALSVSPNPSRGRAVLVLTLERPQHVEAALYDALGRRVAALRGGLLAAGTHRIEVDASALPAGVYVARVVGESSAASRTLTLVR